METDAEKDLMNILKRAFSDEEYEKHKQSAEHFKRLTEYEEQMKTNDYNDALLRTYRGMADKVRNSIIAALIELIYILDERGENTYSELVFNNIAEARRAFNRSEIEALIKKTKSNFDKLDINRL